MFRFAGNPSSQSVVNWFFDKEIYQNRHYPKQYKISVGQKDKLTNLQVHVADMYQVKCKRSIPQQDKQPAGKNPLQPRFLCHSPAMAKTIPIGRINV